MAAPEAGVAWANGKLALTGLQTVKAPTHPAARMARRIRCFHRMSIVGPLSQTNFELSDLPAGTRSVSAGIGRHHYGSWSFTVSRSCFNSAIVLSIWLRLKSSTLKPGTTRQLCPSLQSGKPVTSPESIP